MEVFKFDVLSFGIFWHLNSKFADCLAFICTLSVFIVSLSGKSSRFSEFSKILETSFDQVGTLCWLENCLSHINMVFVSRVFSIFRIRWYCLTIFNWVQKSGSGQSIWASVAGIVAVLGRPRKNLAARR